MAFENLRSQHPLLLQYLTDHHYSSPLIDTVRREITRIIDLSDAEGWKSYADILSAYEKNGWKKKSIDDKRYILRLLERFDIHNEYPIRAQRKSDLFENDRFDSLPTEFQEFAVMCRKRLEESGRKSSTVSVVIGNLLRFLELLHLRGCNSFSDVTETDVIAFFVTETGRHIRGATAKKMLVTALNTGKEWKNGDCARIMPFVPLLQPARKAIQYLTHEEVEAVRFALTEKDVPLSMRDKAMGCILLYMGLRQCDVINLRLNDIDWDKETIQFTQQKTNVMVKIPMPAMVGNAIFDYCVSERPDTEDDHLFLSEVFPYRPLSSFSKVAEHIFKAAGIRQNKGDRHGTHIFRHSIASRMLSNGVSKPVISKILGHTTPDALETYIMADFDHLKECALSVEAYPLTEEVLPR